MLDSSDKRKDELKLIWSGNTDSFRKKLSESCVDLNGELEKGAVGTLEALRTLGRKLWSLQNKELYNNGCKAARKCNCITTDVKKPESEGNNLLMHLNSLAH